MWQTADSSPEEIADDSSHLNNDLRVLWCTSLHDSSDLTSTSLPWNTNDDATSSPWNTNDGARKAGTETKCASQLATRSPNTFHHAMP